MPDDAQKQIGVKGLTWLRKYGIVDAECTDFLWSDSKQWLIFPLYDENRVLLAWQARNFGTPKPKYWTRGNISDILHIVGLGDTAVITEDLLSAIKVGRSSGFAGVPVFGSGIPLKTLTRLYTRFKRVGVWLDMDKWSESLKTHSRASQLWGPDNVSIILTPKDPKEYSDAEIKYYLENPT